MSTDFVTGKINVSENSYDSVEKSVDMLMDLGFKFDYIETDGESSSHMWTCGFNKKYTSIQEFHENALDDYMDQRRRYAKEGGPYLSWETSTYVLTKEDKNTTIKICVHEQSTNDEPQFANYFFWGSKNIWEYDKEFAEKIKEKLDTLNY